MKGCPTQPLHLKALLSDFAISTGLRVNYAKSMLVPFDLTESRTTFLARTFNCSEGSLPFTYLGLPLALTKPKVEEFLPLVTRCERRLLSTSTILTQAGGLKKISENHMFSEADVLWCPPLKIPRPEVTQNDLFGYLFRPLIYKPITYGFSHYSLSLVVFSPLQLIGGHKSHQCGAPRRKAPPRVWYSSSRWRDGRRFPMRTMTAVEDELRLRFPTASCAMASRM